MKLLFRSAVAAILALASVQTGAANDVSLEDIEKIKRAALDYVESQQLVKPEMMKRSLHKKFAKRTFWNSGGEDFISENNYEGMVRLAEVYNKDGKGFPANPKKEVVILDVEGRTASVKLYADDFIDHLHIVKLEDDWKVINALWQFNDLSKHEQK
ncbi:MAG: nuclear transport factor 2 family protein [Kordiimonas sp.]